MSKFKVNAQNIVLLNKNGEQEILKINEEHEVENYDEKDLIILATNSKPLILAEVAKKTGNKNISISDKNFLKSLKEVTGEYKSSIEFLDLTELPKVKKEEDKKEIKK